jgi:hypothetical protein
MKTRLMQWLGATAGLCLVCALTVRAEEGNAAAKQQGPGGGVSREEMEKFKEKLKDMTPEQRQEAIQKFREKHGQKGGGDFGGANREEMEKLREKLKDMTPEQRQEAIKKFREKMGARGGGEGSEQMRERFKNMTPEQRREAMQKMGAKLKERIEQNDKLSAEQKKEILSHMEKMKTEREKIMNDSSLNEEQKREAIQKLHDKGREVMEKYRHIFGEERPHKGPPAKGGDKPKAEPQGAVEAKPSV